MTEKMVIREYYELCDGGICQDLLTESEKRFVRDGGMILSGVIQRCGVPNGNGRIYTENVLKREVGLYQKLVEENRALGELDHPESNIVNLANVSHRMTEVWMDGNDVYGKLQVLNTPSGQILRALVEGGCKIGISSRGTGSLSEGPQGSIVNDDFQLICFDMVSEPSTSGAFMMKENKESNVFTKADKLNRLIQDILS
tara:strand:- start:2252 stop:2848 length:597 start_codon:yes stop_codon:yes gene_type:complete